MIKKQRSAHTPKRVAGGDAPKAPATKMAAAAPQWREMLQRSLKKNKSLPYSRYVQLATVRPDGRPANRTVVFRCGLRAWVCASVFV